MNVTVLLWSLHTGRISGDTTTPRLSIDERPSLARLSWSTLREWSSERLLLAVLTQTVVAVL